MYWAIQEVYVENNTSGVSPWDMIIRASSYLYTQLDVTQPIYLLEASEDGYDTLEMVSDAIFRKLGMEPTSQPARYNCSTGYFSNHVTIDECLEILGDPKFEPTPWNEGLHECVSDLPGSPDRCLVGDCRVSNVNVQCFGGCNEASPFIDAAIMQDYQDEVWHFQYSFTVFDDDFLSSGSFNFSALDYTEDDKAYVGLVTVNIWLQQDGKFNCNIVLSSFIYNFAGIKVRYDGKSVDVKNSEDPNNTNQDPNNKGGNGDGDTGDDPVTVPVLPDSDMTEAGSIRIYAPTKAEIASLFNYLHSANIGDSIYKLWQNPIQGIVSLHYLPYPLTLKSNTKVSIDFVGLPTGVTAYAANQFQSINFGYVKVGNVKNNYLDYSPYTKIQIYLPGIGIRDINTDDVMNKYIRVKYNCDNVTGQFVAFVLVGNTYTESDMSVKYTFSGCVAAPFPISQNNWGNTYIAAATLAAGALAGGVAAAGGAGAAAAGAGAGAGAAEAGAASAAGSEVTAASVGGNITNIGTAALQLAKPSITRAGTVSGTTSLFGVREPFLIIERPNQQDFNDFNKIKGYPCGKTFVLGDISGYNQIESIHLTGIQAMVEEINEIEALLKGGVIL